MLIVKHGGAALSFVIATLRLPLTTLCFYSTAIVGVDATIPTLFDFIGLLILMLGLGAYRYGSAIRLDENVIPEETHQGFEFPETASTVLEISSPESRSLLPILEDEAEDFESDVDEVPLVSLVVEPGPYILRVHHHRSRPLYLSAIRVSSDDLESLVYHPPVIPPLSQVNTSNQQEQGTDRSNPPRRRTMHDFREAQIQKIHKRRLPFVSTTAPFPEGRIQSSTTTSVQNDDSDNEGHLSDGSINSLTSTTRPHPLELPEPTTYYSNSSPRLPFALSEFKHPQRSISSPRVRLHPDSILLSPSYPSSSPESLSSIPLTHLTTSLQTSSRCTRLPPLSVMLDGGLDLAVVSSPKSTYRSSS